MEDDVATITREGDAWCLRAPEPRGASLRLEGPWDWSAAAAVVWEMDATSNARIRVEVEHARGAWRFHVVPKPGLRLRVAVSTRDLQVSRATPAAPGHFIEGGGPDPVDLAAVRAVTFSYDQDGPPAALRVEALRAEPTEIESAVLDPHPLVDAFGQWSGLQGAPRSEAEVRAAWAAEEGDGGAAPPPDRSRWGGDARVRLEASGRFRVDQHQGYWALVDPDGHPFFSVGPDVVAPQAEGPTLGKEGLFAEVGPARTAAGGADFHAANLRRRYGPQPAARWAEVTRRRLAHWGFNTIGHWSDVPLAAGGSVPWVTGLCGVDSASDRLPDVFDPAFPVWAREAVRPHVGAHRHDPALIGYFLGNEPAWTWSGAIHPLQTVFAGEYRHTSAAALAWLRERYRDDVDALGQAWGTTHRSWEEMARAGPPDPRTGTPALRADAAEFGGWLLARFYAVCCAEVRALDPGHLLLGPRFYSAAMPDAYLRACRVFDAVSFNCYQRELAAADLSRLEALAGRPVLIGEFSFGVCGRGMSGGLVTVRNDAERGEAYGVYLRAALAHPARTGSAGWTSR